MNSTAPTPRGEDRSPHAVAAGNRSAGQEKRPHVTRETRKYQRGALHRPGQGQRGKGYCQSVSGVGAVEVFLVFLFFFFQRR